MGRPKALDRKKQLLEEIIQHLQHRTLASVTFRTLADALGVSSYVLVYQFGNRDALLGDIVREVDYRVLNLDLPAELEFDFEGFAEITETSMRRLEDPKTRHLLRLQTEAATMDIVSDNPTNSLDRYLDMWVGFIDEYLEDLGYPKDFARTTGDAFINELIGIRLRYMLTGESEPNMKRMRDAVARLKKALVENIDLTSLSEDEMLTKTVRITPRAQALAIENRPNPAR
jgi:AcrR family transcriptional regulator